MVFVGVRVPWYCFLVLTGLVSLPPHATSLEGNRAIRSIAVQDVLGRAVKPLDGKSRRATLLVFIAHDCPISNAYSREVARIGKQYALRGIASYVVYIEKDLPRSRAHKHWREYGYPFPGLMDADRKLVRLAGATMTPEAALVSADGKIIYRGRIDDTYIDYGKRRNVPQSRDLRQAIEAFLSKRPVDPNRTPVVGCYIPDI